MKTKTILFPTDFSSQSDAGLEYASSLARDMGAELVIVHVLEEPAIYTGEFYYGNAEPDVPAVTKMLHAVKPSLEGVSYRHHLLRGDAAESVCEFARKDDTDLIVMGTHGRTGLGRLLMGSVAELIVRTAPCPVLTLRSDALKSAAGS